MIDVISPKQQAILLALARYKFLTTSHMMILGLDKYKQNLNNNLVRLRERKKKLINYVNFGMGKEYFYYLTARGKQLLVDHLSLEADQVKAPIGRSSFFTTDYKHRKGFIHCLIQLYQSAEQQGFVVDFCDLYFEKLGNNRRDKNLQSKARIDLKNRHIEADAIFMTSKANQHYLYVLEYERKRDSKYIYKKCRDYLEALTIGEPSIKYGFQKGCRILYVFETKSMMEAVLKRLQQDADFKPFYRYFFFKYVKELEFDFLKNWLTFSGERVDAY